MFKQLLHALFFLHQKGVSHGDLRPEHIMIDDECTVKIVDYGLSKHDDNVTDPEMLHEITCSPHTLSPEFCSLEPCYKKSELADLFALGVILFMMRLGHRPFALAHQNEPFYKLLTVGRTDLFWKSHSNIKGGNSFGKEFQDLITLMLL